MRKLYDSVLAHPGDFVRVILRLGAPHSTWNADKEINCILLDDMTGTFMGPNGVFDEWHSPEPYTTIDAWTIIEVLSRAFDAEG